MVNTAFGVAIYPILLWTFPWLQKRYMVGLGIAQAISIIFAFVNYKHMVFKTSGNSKSEFIRFFAFYLINFGSNWIALPFLVEIMKINPIIAQTIFVIIIMVTSYFWHNRITFKSFGAKN